MPPSEIRRPRWVLLAGTAALVGLHLWVGRHVDLPRRGPGDQWGYVGSARFLAGDPHTYVMPPYPYFTYGYSIVLAPLVRVFHEPETLFAAIKLLNAALAASALPLLYAFSRRLLQASPRQALAGAAVGSVVPPLVVHPSSILAENLVLPLVVATMLACWQFLSGGPTWSRLLFAPAMVWLHVSHNRFAAALPLFLLVLAVGARARLVPARLAAANAGVALALLTGAQAVRNAIVEARWVYGIETPQGPASDVVEVLTQRRLFQELLLVAVGQAWYLVVGTLGLAALGVWAVWRQIRTPDDEVGLGQDPRRLTLAFLFGSASAVFITSTYFFTRVVNGSEGFVAGRHNDSFVPIWVAAGAVLLMSTPATPRVRSLGLAVTAVAVGLSAVLLWGRRGGDLHGLYSALNVPSIVHLGASAVGGEARGDIVVQRGSIIAVGSLLVLAVVAHLGRRPAVLLPLASLWLVGSAAAQVEPDRDLEGWSAPEQIARLDVPRVSVDQAGPGGLPVYYPYFLPSTVMVPWDRVAEPPEPFVLAGRGADLTDRGGRVAMIDEPVANELYSADVLSLWVLPGPDQDRLDATGALLPAGFPAALPVEARRVELEAPEGEVVLMEPGGSAQVAIRGRHAGHSAPWPDLDSAGRDGSVRLRARPTGPAGPATPRAEATAELPGWLWPGDRFETELRLVAVDAKGRPLAPGLYEVTIEVEQRGFDVFSTVDEKPLTLVLDVRDTEPDG